MDPCPYAKRGQHALMAIIPEDSDHDLTLCCSVCGAMRRTPASGVLVSGGSKDALTAAEIDAMWAPR
jgi:hypothetical protein